MERLIKSLLLLALLAMFNSCSTQKRKGEISKAGLFYHNTTAKFNGYFNANVLLTESIAKLNDQHRDNYNQILDMYPYVSTDNAQSVAGDLDEAIKKVSVVVSLHRPSHWTDDCYLLIGKAQYLKKSYEDAEETLLYFKEEFSPEAMKAKKKAQKKSKKKTSAKKRKKNSKKKKASSKKKKKKGSKSQAKKRKEYNKQVKRNKKKRKKNNSKKKKSSKKDSSKKEKEKVEAPKAKEDKGKKKKEKKVADKPSTKPEEDENYLLKHRPVYQEGMLWLARTYIERDNFAEADAILSQLDRNPKTFDDVRSQLAGVRAYYHIEQRNYELAVAPLEIAINNSKDKQEKARFAYIVAQIHQKAGRSDEAYASFQRALKYSNSYEMEFSSKLNIAQNAWYKGEATAAQTTKTLRRMLKDIKNEEYQDQIYYALAEISLKGGDRQEGIAYLKQSLRASTDNESQRTESYLQLAELYFEDQEYVSAKNYFDSTLQVMVKTDERYDRVKSFSTNLTDIANNIKIIMLQDSLLAINQLDEKDRLALAYQIKKQQEEDRLRKIKEAGSKKGGGKTNPRKGGSGKTIRRSSASTRVAPSTFFAYDDKKVKKGKREFERRWGDRQLDDNWRRSNRRGIGNELAEEISEESLAAQLTPEEMDKIFKDVPQTPAQIAAANKKIQDAMFVLGGLYRDRLENNPKAIETLEQLVERFPETEYRLDAWYYLYLAHKDMNDRAKAKIYYDKIVSNYPQTKYARALEDPNFLAASKEEERKLVSYYDVTYTAFQNGEYKQAIDRASKAEELFGQANILKPKFALLSALCVGNLKGREAYEAALKDVIAKYPDTQEQKRAKEILRLLTGKNITDAGVTTDSKFKVEKNKVHYFIVILKNSSIKLSDAKIAVSNYHREYHKLDRLRISNIYLGADTNTPILVIRKFKNKDVAMKYYNGVRGNASSYMPDEADYELYTVTQHNYRQILKSKTLEGYREFFEDTYLED
ncbi:MAG: tetratricopeptide repeat protein [Bacteroidota bacterium]